MPRLYVVEANYETQCPNSLREPTYNHALTLTPQPGDRIVYSLWVSVDEIISCNRQSKTPDRVKDFPVGRNYVAVAINCDNTYSAGLGDDFDSPPSPTLEADHLANILNEIFNDQAEWEYCPVTVSGFPYSEMYSGSYEVSIKNKRWIEESNEDDSATDSEDLDPTDLDF